MPPPPPKNIYRARPHVRDRIEAAESKAFCAYLEDLRWVDAHATAAHAAGEVIVEVLQVHARVVALLLLRVREHRVGLANVLEHGLGRGLLFLSLGRVAIRVVLERRLLVCLLELSLVCALGHAQDLVVVLSLGLLDLGLELSDAARVDTEILRTPAPQIQP
jgi:hypothetical protein